MFKPVSLGVIASLLLATPVSAQDKTAEVDKIFSFATPETPGCAVGVSRQGKVIVNRAYGLANVETRVPLSQRSLFDIGSTQKQFTAAAVLLLVQDGRLSLSDDVRKRLPELPDYGHKVTIDHLLTHTAGIRDWTGLLPLAPEGTDVLRLILRQRALAIALENNQLHGQPAGGPKRLLTHVSGTTYSVADSPMTLTFTIGADRRATALVMRQNGRERTLSKMR
jgi:CubicO group peptidase (beta-lactamase class C family)